MVAAPLVPPSVLRCQLLSAVQATRSNSKRGRRLHGYSAPLADFTALAYHTFQSSAAVPIQLPSLNLTIDFNGPGEDGGFATLVFEPVYNPAQGPIVPQTWQDWDAILGGNAIWWSTRAFGTVCV